MKRLLLITAAALLSLPARSDLPATTQPTALPATRPSVAAATMPVTAPAMNPISRYFSSRREERSSRGSSAYPVEKLTNTQYSVLEKRSMFYRGILPLDGGTRTERREERTTRIPDPPGPVPEQSLVFEGAMSFDNDMVALVEDFSGAKGPMWLHMGDPIANGKLGMISLNSLEYINKSGKTIRVAVGKNLEGVDPPTTRPSLFVTSDTSSPSSPSSPTTAGSSSGGSATAVDALMAKLRARRKAETGN